MDNRRQREVLVVDHELADLELMCTALRKEGHRALPASGYLAGLNTFGLHVGDIDLLVAAVALPERNGCELAKRVLALEPNLRVLFVSATSGAEICRFYGMLGPGLYFLEKPLQRDEFIRLVRLILDEAASASA
jgi:two-component system cell cycle sensor histidine kinase/response regulator CckA